MKQSPGSTAATPSPSRWSPLTCLAPVSLTTSGLLQLNSDDGEVELVVRSNVEIRSDSTDPIPFPSPKPQPQGLRWEDRDELLTCHLTTHRLVLIDEANRSLRGCVPLALVEQATPSGGPSVFSPRSSYKIALSTHAWGDLLVVFRGTKNNSSSAAGKDRDEILSSLQKCLDRKAWDDKARTAERQKHKASTTIAARKVGVDAILTKNALKHREAAQLADDAFADGGDVEVLMKEAGELVKIIRKYVATLERERGEQGVKTGGDDAEDAARLTGMLEDMGMASATSKKQSGTKNMYHQTLARQITDFLRHRNRLQDAGGMMTLTDVYCLFNRARGTNMMSPDDLLGALQWMKELRLGLSRRDFPSGVICVQDDAFDDEVMARKLCELAAEDGSGITALDASRSLKVSALLANEQLLSAERMGRLCRDVTLEGIRFFPNRFATDFMP